MDALERIVRFLNRTPPERLRNFLPALYDILYPSRVPRPDVFDAPAPDFRIVHRVALALEILYQSPIVQISMETAPELWERVWPWVQFIYQFREMLGTNLPAGPFVSAVLVGAMGRITEHSVGMRDKIMKPEERTLLSIMVTIFVNDERIDLAWLVVEQIRVLDLPKNSADEKTMKLFALMAHLVTYFDRDLSRGHPLSPFAQELLRNGFSRALAQGVCALSTSRTLLLFMLFDAPSGHAYVHEAVDAGLVLALLNIAQGSLSTRLQDIVGSFGMLIFPGTTIRFKALEAFKGSREAIRKLTGMRGYGEVWKVFDTLLQERLEVYDDHVAMNHERLKMCANLKVCEVFRQGHTDAEIAIQALNPDLTRRDRSFMRTIMDASLSGQRIDILSLQLRIIKQHPEQQLITQFDYTHGLLSFDANGEAAAEDIKRRAETSGGRTAVAVCKYHGAGVHVGEGKTRNWLVPVSTSDPILAGMRRLADSLPDDVSTWRQDRNVLKVANGLAKLLVETGGSNAVDFH
ncbi:hypothetical protein C8F01DRAFT_1369696 [Mycena amicta]|nr:hypothetical protein C8F01DRAFT_1369696 [Mycena amicta]